MNRTVLFIDGENFFSKIEHVLRRHRVALDGYDPAKTRYDHLLKRALDRYVVSESIVYVARLHVHADEQEKSNQLIEAQQKLHEVLSSQGLVVKIAGNVRAQRVRADNKTTLVFREKGVDVHIAVDLVVRSLSHEIDTAILCSSDSDLQSAVQEARKHGVRVVYLGFETQPNRGLTRTTDETVLFTDALVLESCGVQTSADTQPRRKTLRRTPVTSGERRSPRPRKVRTRKQVRGRSRGSRRAD